MLHPSIVTFLHKHHLLSMCTSADNQPYAANCFYAFSPTDALFIVATDRHTRHGTQAIQNPYVAGTVALETTQIGKIQGVQFTGIFREANEKEQALYFQRFAYAKVMHPSLWTIEISYLKFTDNTLGFGKKLEFTRV